MNMRKYIRLVACDSHAIGALTHDFVCEDRFEIGAEELR